MTLITTPHDSQLDLDVWVGQRSATFRFSRIDGVTGQNLGPIHPVRDQPPTLTHDTTRTIKRTLSPLVLDETDTAATDPINNRIAVTMVIGGTEWPLGRYVFINQTKIRTTRGLRSSSSLVDEMFIVDQKIESAFSCNVLNGGGTSIISGEVVNVAVERLLAGLPVTATVEPTAFSSIGSWPQGTNRGRILDDLALDGDYFSPWFDGTGVMRMIRAFDPATRIPTFDWDANRVVIRDSITEVSDLVSAPNRIVVVSNTPGVIGTGVNPVFGTYDVPSSAPHSELNRGFIITDVRELQVTSNTQAAAVAANIGQRETVFEYVDATTPPDPRFDSYDVVRWQGSNWLELAWTMQLREGGEMRHSMRKVYS